MLIKSGGDWMRLLAVILSVLLSLWPLTSASA